MPINTEKSKRAIPTPRTRYLQLVLECNKLAESVERLEVYQQRDSEDLLVQLRQLYQHNCTCSDMKNGFVMAVRQILGQVVADDVVA